MHCLAEVGIVYVLLSALNCVLQMCYICFWVMKLHSLLCIPDSY